MYPLANHSLRNIKIKCHLKMLLDLDKVLVHTIHICINEAYALTRNGLYKN